MKNTISSYCSNHEELVRAENFLEQIRKLLNKKNIKEQIEEDIEYIYSLFEKLGSSEKISPEEEEIIRKVVKIILPEGQKVLARFRQYKISTGFDNFDQMNQMNQYLRGIFWGDGIQEVKNAIESVLNTKDGFQRIFYIENGMKKGIWIKLEPLDILGCATEFFENARKRFSGNHMSSGVMNNGQRIDVVEYCIDKGHGEDHKFYRKLSGDSDSNNLPKDGIYLTQGRFLQKLLINFKNQGMRLLTVKEIEGLISYYGEEKITSFFPDYGFDYALMDETGSWTLRYNSNGKLIANKGAHPFGGPFQKGYLNLKIVYLVKD